MKFISKNTNLLVVLRAGLSAQPLTGTPAKPTISVRFKDGIADVQEEEMVNMMLSHPGFNSDFISAESTLEDPYKYNRQSAEPTHEVTEMQFGTPVKKEVHGDKKGFPPELQKIINSAAIEMAKQMLPSMVEGTIKSLLVNKKKKPGRKPFKKNVENNVDSVENTVPSVPNDSAYKVDENIEPSTTGQATTGQVMQ